MRGPPLAWLEARVGCVLTPHATGVAVVREDGTPAAMAAFDRWTGSAAEAHVACEAPVAFRLLAREGLSYAFGPAGRTVLLALVREDNARSLSLCARLGFRRVHTVADGAASGVGLILHEMRREDCRVPLPGVAHGR